MKTSTKKSANIPNDDYILLFDVGGTWTKVATATRNKIISKKIFATKDFKIEDIKLIVQNSNIQFSMILIASAGPINNGTCKMTNADLVFDERALFNMLKVKVVVINDLAAIAYGLKSKHKASIVVGIGTGLGVSMISESREIIPSEEGHLVCERDFFFSVPEFRGLIIPQYEHLLSGKNNVLIRIFNKSFIALNQETVPGKKSVLKYDRFTELYLQSLNLFINRILLIHKDIKITKIIFTGGVVAGNKKFIRKYSEEIKKTLKKNKIEINDVTIIDDDFLGIKGILEFFREKQSMHITEA